jgi:riboflavin biosynthesis pyrimidine reductase
MRQLAPTHLDEVDLRAAYAYPTDVGDRAWLRANMVSSLDGAAVVDGRSGALGGAGDKEVFDLLRGLADAVLVGAGTARIEGYRAKDVHADPRAARPRAALGQRPVPVLVLVSARLALDPASELFHGGLGQTIVLTPASSPADRRALLADVAEVVVAGEDRLDVGAALDALAERGLSRLLCEGGPTLLADVSAAGRLDELCLTVTPRLVGGEARRIMRGAMLDQSFELAHLLDDDSTLFARYVRSETR